MRNKVILFGGTPGFGFKMEVLDEEGKLEADLSDDPLIPGYMNFGSFTAHKGEINAVGFNDFNDQMEWSLRTYDLSKWTE